MASDLDIVNAARVSYGRHVDTLTSADEKLLAYLIKSEHGSPFEAPVFRFRVKTAIAIAREWFRHRIGSFSEMSTRYVEMPEEFYQHRPDQMRKQIGKPGHYQFVPADQDGVPSEAQIFVEMLTFYYKEAYAAYRAMLDKGMPRELARNILPLGTMTQFIWTVNLRSLFNFLKLRNAAACLLEFREEAQQVEQFVTDVLPVTMDLWQKCGRPKI